MKMEYDVRTGRYVAGTLKVDGDVVAEAVADSVRDQERDLGRALTAAERQEIEADLLRPANWADLSAADRGVDDPADADGPSDAVDTEPELVVIRPDATPETAEGLERRYFAGVHSLVDRAEFRPECCWQKIGSPAGDAGEMPYHDYDIEVGVVVGDAGERSGAWGTGSRSARAELTFGLHVCGSGRLETQPLYVEEEGWIDVRSTVDRRARTEIAHRNSVWDEAEPLPDVGQTRFALRPREVALLKARILLVLAGRWLGEGLPR